MAVVLRIMHKQIKTYNSKLYYFPGLIYFNRYKPAIDAINKFGIKNKALSIETYTFFAFYTNILQSNLKNNNEIVNQFLFSRW